MVIPVECTFRIGLCDLSAYTLATRAIARAYLMHWLYRYALTYQNGSLVQSCASAIFDTRTTIASVILKVAPIR